MLVTLSQCLTGFYSASPAFLSGASLAGLGVQGVLIAYLSSETLLLALVGTIAMIKPLEKRGRKGPSWSRSSQSAFL